MAYWEAAEWNLPFLPFYKAFSLLKNPTFPTLFLDSLFLWNNLSAPTWSTGILYLPSKLG